MTIIFFQEPVAEDQHCGSAVLSLVGKDCCGTDTFECHCATTTGNSDK